MVKFDFAHSRGSSKNMTNSATYRLPTIRVARREDAAALAPLVTQLGYPATTAQIDSRLALVLRDSGQLVAVAEVSGRVAAWIHAALYQTLESGTAVEIRGLVVEEKLRGRGLGGALLGRAEQWARDQGARVVRLRSNVIRNGAHDFYQHMGYTIVKTQHAFRKDLN